jgi:hypothetical protein
VSNFCSAKMLILSFKPPDHYTPGDVWITINRQLDFFLVRKQIMKHSITSSISYTTLNTENTDVESWRNLVCWLVK